MSIGITSRVFINNEGSRHFGLTGQVICTTRPVLGLKERMYQVVFDVPRANITEALFFANELCEDTTDETNVPKAL
jgi:hypothetical protein